ncbi:MAG: FAD/NAD(P)-binding protein [Candidatus Puniceispirillaceae bacterium]
MSKISAPDHSIKMAVIGAGFTSASLICQLLEAGYAHEDIMIIGKGVLGHGHAYGTHNPAYRLNVSADLQSLRAQREETGGDSAFKEWAKTHCPDDDKAYAEQGIFYQRQDFARYVSEELENVNASAITHIKEDVTSLALMDPKDDASDWMITTEKGMRMKASYLLLATGNGTPRLTFSVSPQAQAHDKLITSPWAGDFYNRLLDGAPHHITIIGGGLSALDILMGLDEADYGGMISLITPVGMLPPVQSLWQIERQLAPFPDKVTAASFIHHIRSHLKQAGHWESPQWQSRFEEIRLSLNDGWCALSQTDKQRVMARFGKWWSLARYRAAPQAINLARSLIEEKRLSVIKDRVQHITVTRGDFVLTGVNDAQYITQGLINASGTTTPRLITDMIEQGLAAPDDFAQSVAVNQDNQIIRPDGRAYQSCFLFGPGTAASLGDVVGAYSIAKQIQKIVKKFNF